jgi:hypothetical protein
MITSADQSQISAKGISAETILYQLSTFENGFPFVDIVKPAVIGDGIICFSENQINELINVFNIEAPKNEMLKFVPASGAATRMFKDLFAFREKHVGEISEDEISKQSANPSSVVYLMENIEKLACYDDLKSVMQKNKIDLVECLKKRDYNTIIDFMLNENGLDYARLPKGLLKFHRYDDFNRTSIEEHLVEGAHYAGKPDSSVEVHFTISSEHKEKIIKHISDVMPVYEKLFDVNFKITYSEQKPSTDTIAVDMNNQPFRDSNGELVFRPAGHGSLIENLNDLKADIVFIKNIDNVVPDSIKPETYRYKKAIGGFLLSLKRKIHEYLNNLEQKKYDEKIISEISGFVKNELEIILKDEFDILSLEDKAKTLHRILNRPLRICGMVKNEGEPGGGPFWVRDSKGKVSLQIVESSQINLNDETQNKLFRSSTHFNPVDIVCALRDHKGKNFHLPEYVDNQTGFISFKSKDGAEIKALELPGLWNGAMADWITLFVEVPIITFNPVKTINDLLRKQHQ